MSARQSHAILVVDRHPIVQNALVSALRGLVSVTRVDTVASWAEARDCVQCSAYDLVIADCVAQGKLETGHCRFVRDQLPFATVLMFSADESQRAMSLARDAAIEGFIGKSASLTTLLTVIEKQLAGLAEYPVLRRQDSSGHAILPAHFPVMLSRRRQAILSRLLAGQSNREIAVALGIAEGTVKNHVSHIMRAFEVNSRPRLLLRAQSLGLV